MAGVSRCRSPAPPASTSGCTSGRPTRSHSLWSNGRYLERPGNRGFDIHPDGDRIALSPVVQKQEADSEDTVVFIFNVDDELRRIAPTASK